MTFTSATARISTLIAVLALHAAAATDASAVSLRVKLACARDYYAHCSAFRPDTPEVRRCMRGVGSQLSPRCVNALASAGEISQVELRRHAAAQKRRERRAVASRD